MNSFPTTPCLASVGEYIPFFGMLIPIALFIVVLLVIALSLYFKNQSRLMWHETARIALEKGQPIPAMAEITVRKPDQPSGRIDVKAGLILIAVAAGLYFGGVPSIAVYIPGFIGVALLINALITFLSIRKNPANTSAPQPPKA